MSPKTLASADPPAGFDRIAAEYERLGMRLLDEDDYVLGNDRLYASTENLMHEVAHALLLNVHLEHGFWKAVAHLIDQLPAEDQWHEEAKAWAVQWQASKKIGFYLHRGDVLDAAAIQGCDAEVVDEMLEDPKYEDTAERLARYMRGEG